MIPSPPAAYHPAITRLLARRLDRNALARLPRAEPNHHDALAALVHAAALRASERHIQLARTIKHAATDLQAATEELAEARPAEHLLTGRHDELLVAAHRHHDALTHLDALARALAAATNASAP